MEDRIARGVNFVYAKEYVIQQYGDAGWQRIAARLPGDAAEVWRNPIALSTYPFSSFMALIRSLGAESGGSSEEKLARMYEHIADRSLNSLYKVFFRLANPGFVVGNYPKLWSRFFTSGDVQVTEQQPGGAVLRFTLPEMFLEWLPAACLGYSTKAVMLGGGRLLSLREVSRSRTPAGEWVIAYNLRWQG